MVFLGVFVRFVCAFWWPVAGFFNFGDAAGREGVCTIRYTFLCFVDGFFNTVFVLWADCLVCTVSTYVTMGLKFDGGPDGIQSCRAGYRISNKYTIISNNQ
jgi:hypothetical protein